MAELTLVERLEARAARALIGLAPVAPRWLLRRHPALHPEIAVLLALRDLVGRRPFHALSVEAARAQLRREARVHAGAPIPVAVRALTVAGGAGALAARHYAPPSARHPRPLLVFFHGGGFVLGDLDTHDAACRALCRGADVHVLSVDYRLAPQHRFPAAVDDAFAALRWAQAHAGALGADPVRVAVGGDSAGGNLAAVVAQLGAQAGTPPAAQILIYPAVDRTRAWASLERFAHGPLITRADAQWFFAHYAPGHDLSDPRISPLRAPSLAGLCPALVVTAGFDALCDEGEAYAAALWAAGVRARLHRVPDLAHGFINMAGVSRASRAALMGIAAHTRSLLEEVAR